MEQADSVLVLSTVVSRFLRLSTCAALIITWEALTGSTCRCSEATILASFTFLVSVRKSGLAGLMAILELLVSTSATLRMRREKSLI